MIAFEAHHLETLVDPRLDLGSRERPCLEAEGDVLRNRQVRENGIVLEDHADIALMRRLVVDPLALDDDLAAILVLEARDRPQKGRLAAAARAEKREEFTGRDIEIDTLKDPDVADNSSPALGSSILPRSAPSRFLFFSFHAPSTLQKICRFSNMPTGYLSDPGRIKMLKAGLTAGVLLASMSVAAMAQDKTVVVYTAHKASIVDALVPKFEKDTGIKVDVVKAGSGDIIKRVKAESSAPKADVIWSIGGEQLEDNKDLLATYKPKDDAVLVPAYKVSPEWIPYTGILLVMAVNKKDLKPADYPKTLGRSRRPQVEGQDLVRTGRYLRLLASSSSPPFCSPMATRAGTSTTRSSPTPICPTARARFPAT